MPCYRFGDFQLNPSRRELLRDGQPVELAAKALDLIVYLIDHRDRAVGRDELISGVWGRLDVSDNVLDQMVLRARRALDDGGQMRRFIATRPRFGFAWVAPVSLDTAQEPVDALPAAPVERKKPRRVVLAAALAVLTLAAVALWWRWPSAPRVEAETVAALPATSDATVVLPFDIAPDADASWVRLGLMDTVAQRLRSAGLETLPSDNVVALVRGVVSEPTDDEATRALAARADAARIVRGRVEKTEGQWQVGLRLLGPDRLAVEVQARATQPLEAAMAAADRLVLALGRVPAEVALPGDAPLALQLQQIDAAVLGDALDVARRLLEAIPPAQRDEAAVRLRAATVRFRAGELDAAAVDFQNLLSEVSAGDDALLHAKVLTALANVAVRRGDAAGAQPYIDEAATLLASLPPSTEFGRALVGRATVHSMHGRFDAALEDYSQARVVFDSVGDRLGTARVDTDIGILDARRDRYAEAEPRLAAAADRLASFNDLTNELFARVTLAQVRLGLLDPAAALSGDARLAELAEREPSGERRRYVELTRAQVLAANGRMRKASALLASVRAASSDAGDVVLLGAAQALGAQLVLEHDPAAAAREAQVALNAPWEDEGPRTFAGTWRVLVRSHLALGELSAAKAGLTGFEAWAARKDVAQAAATLWLARAEVAAAQGEPAAAGLAYETALAAAESARVPAELREVAASYSAWLVTRGDATRAMAVVGRVAGWADRDYDTAVLTARLHRALGHQAAWQAMSAQARRLAGERALPPEFDGQVTELPGIKI